MVFRVVLANPLTTHEILSDMLEEQAGIAREERIAGERRALESAVASVLDDRERMAQ